MIFAFFLPLLALDTSAPSHLTPIAFSSGTVNIDALPQIRFTTGDTFSLSIPANTPLTITIAIADHHGKTLFLNPFYRGHSIDPIIRTATHFLQMPGLPEEAALSDLANAEIPLRISVRGRAVVKLYLPATAQEETLVLGISGAPFSLRIEATDSNDWLKEEAND